MGVCKVQLMKWNKNSKNLKKNKGIIQSAFTKIGPVLQDAVASKLKISLIQAQREHAKNEIKTLIQGENEQNPKSMNSQNLENKEQGQQAQEQQQDVQQQQNEAQQQSQLVNNLQASQQVQHPKSMNSQILENANTGDNDGLWQLSTDNYEKLLVDLQSQLDKYEEDVKTVNNDWDHHRRKSALSSIYSLIQQSNLTPSEIQCVAELGQQRVKYLFQYGTNSMGQEITDKAIVDRIKNVVNHRHFGVFWKRIIMNIYEQYKHVTRSEINETFPPTDKELDACILYWLNECDMDDSLHFLFDEWDNMEVDLFTSNHLKDVGKDEQNQCDKNILLFSELRKIWNETDDIMYDIGKKASVFCYSNFFTICANCMAGEWEVVKNGCSSNIQSSFKQLVLKIISGKCFKNYYVAANKPTLAKLQIARAELCQWLRSVLISKESENGDDEWEIKDADEKKATQLPNWVNNAHFPLLFGFFVPLLLLNHFPFRKHGTDVYGVDISALLTNKEKIFINGTSFTTFLSQIFRVYMDPQKCPCIKNKSAIWACHYEALFNTIRNNREIKTHKWSNFCKWIIKQQHWITWIYFKEIMAHPLGRQLTSFAKTHGNWSDKKIWNFGDIELPSNALVPLLSWSLVPTIWAIPTSTGKQLAVRFNVPMPKNIKHVVIVASKVTPGFDLMTYDKYGMRLDEKESKVLDKFARSAGLYPVLVNGTYTQEQTFVSMYKNGKILDGSLICIAQVAEPIKQTGTSQKWLNSKAMRFDASMFCYVCQNL